jgi:hypothetical protein
MASERFQLLEEIKFPIEVKKIVAGVVPGLFPANGNSGAVVRVRLAGDTACKTHLGFMLGEMVHPGMILTAFDTEEQAVCVHLRSNPAMFVPALKRVVWGAESWWGLVKDAEDLEREITDQDIENTPYVAMLRQLMKGE